MFYFRELQKSEYADALQLALRVFMTYEAPDYPEAGTATFTSLLHDEEFIAQLRCYGAFDTETDRLVGMIATRLEGAHITLFFVDGDCHRRGIGKALMKLVCEDRPAGKLTVNSSPYAVRVYEKLGFETTGPETCRDGIRYVPMELSGRSQNDPHCGEGNV